MPVATENFGAVVLLLEAKIHCDQIIRACERLSIGADHWKSIANGIDDGTTFPPIEIVGQCSIVLGAAASISKLLFIGKRRGKIHTRTATRCRKLLFALGSPSLPTMSSLEVRNAWEHLDERLDEVLEPKNIHKVAQIHVFPTPPGIDTLALRHFDPVNFSIKFGALDQIDLSALLTEARDLSLRIDAAIQNLHTQVLNVYQ